MEVRSGPSGVYRWTNGSGSLTECMPPWWFFGLDHPGSPCLIESELDPDLFDWTIICLTCGRTNLSPEEDDWWMSWSRIFPKAIEAAP
jgi:hypothetical protein